MKDYVKDLYQKLSESMVKTTEAFYFDDFDLRGGELYYRAKDKPLTYDGGKLRMVKQLKEILHKKRLNKLGFMNLWK